MVQLSIPLEAAPGDGRRRTAWKRLAAKYPTLKWRVQLSIPPELAETFPPEDRQEFFFLDHAEAGLPLLVTPDPEPPGTPEPPPIKRVSLKLAYEMTVRAGPGQTYDTLGKLDLGTVADFTDEQVQDAKHAWRRLADGYNRQTAWIAERTLNNSSVFLVDPT